MARKQYTQLHTELKEVLEQDAGSLKPAMQQLVQETLEAEMAAEPAQLTTRYLGEQCISLWGPMMRGDADSFRSTPGSPSRRHRLRSTGIQ